MFDDVPRKKDERVPLPVRVPKSLKKEIEKRGGARRGDLTAVIVGDLEIGSSLYRQRLDPAFRQCLVRIAAEEGLEWGASAPEVYAKLTAEAVAARNAKK